MIITFLRLIGLVPDDHLAELSRILHKDSLRTKDKTSDLVRLSGIRTDILYNCSTITLLL